jgi:hypothetical protein
VGRGLDQSGVPDAYRRRSAGFRIGASRLALGSNVLWLRQSQQQHLAGMICTVSSVSGLGGLMHTLERSSG